MRRSFACNFKSSPTQHVRPVRLLAPLLHNIAMGMGMRLGMGMAFSAFVMCFSVPNVSSSAVIGPDETPSFVQKRERRWGLGWQLNIWTHTTNGRNSVSYCFARIPSLRIIRPQNFDDWNQIVWFNTVKLICFIQSRNSSLVNETKWKSETDFQN